MTMHPDQWTVRGTMVYCDMEADEEHPAIGDLVCNEDDTTDQFTLHYAEHRGRPWVDEVTSLELTGADAWADDPYVTGNFCFYDGSGDDSHYGIECHVDCRSDEHCLYKRTLLDITVESWSSNYTLVGVNGDYVELDRHTLEEVATGNITE